jgi:glycosyltransferase involved in cell wall biosynthesis
MISICIPVKNRAENLIRCIESIQKLNGDIEIVIGDNDSTDIDYNNLPLTSPHSVVIESYSGDWSIGRAKNVAAERAKGDILFFLDADLIMVQEVIDKIAKLVPAGWVYAPIMWSQNEDRQTGDWITSSYGQVAVTKEQWQNHQWLEFKSYGVEDNLFVGPYTEKQILLRDMPAGFVHLWHPHEERLKYYKNPPGYDADIHIHGKSKIMRGK